jgi:hypothetical protein
VDLSVKEDALRILRTIRTVRIAFAVFLATAAILIGETTLFAREVKKPKEKTVTIVGRVAAKVWDVQNIPTFGAGKHSGNMTVFILWMESGSHTKEPEKYVQVSYLYSSNEESLPESFFDYSIRYQFHVVRDSRCDGFVTDVRDPESEKSSGISAEIKPAKSSPLLDWHHHRPLDCYVLHAADYKIRAKP